MYGFLIALLHQYLVLSRLLMAAVLAIQTAFHPSLRLSPMAVAAVMLPPVSVERSANVYDPDHL